MKRWTSLLLTVMMLVNSLFTPVAALAEEPEIFPVGYAYAEQDVRVFDNIDTDGDGKTELAQVGTILAGGYVYVTYGEANGQWVDVVFATNNNVLSAHAKTEYLVRVGANAIVPSGFSYFDHPLSTVEYVEKHYDIPAVSEPAEETPAEPEVEETEEPAEEVPAEPEAEETEEPAEEVPAEPEVEETEEPAEDEVVVEAPTTLTVEHDGAVITVSGEAGVIPAGAELQVETVTDVSGMLESVVAALDAQNMDLVSLSAYDITLLVNGEVVQPNANVQVSISDATAAIAAYSLTEEELAETQTFIFHVNNGSAELVSTMEGVSPVSVFSVPHFSVYAKVVGALRDPITAPTIDEP